LFGDVRGAGGLGVPPHGRFIDVHVPEERQFGHRLFERHARAEADHALGQRGAQLTWQQTQFFIRGKTCSAGRAHRIDRVHVQRCALASGSHGPTLASAWLQLAAAGGASWSLISRLSRHIRSRTGMHNLAQRLRL